jgi:hypothetical protein
MADLVPKGLSTEMGAESIDGRGKGNRKGVLPSILLYRSTPFFFQTDVFFTPKAAAHTTHECRTRSSID